MPASVKEVLLCGNQTASSFFYVPVLPLTRLPKSSLCLFDSTADVGQLECWMCLTHPNCAMGTMLSFMHAQAGS